MKRAFLSACFLVVGVCGASAAHYTNSTPYAIAYHMTVSVWGVPYTGNHFSLFSGGSTPEAGNESNYIVESAIIYPHANDWLGTFRNATSQEIANLNTYGQLTPPATPTPTPTPTPAPPPEITTGTALTRTFQQIHDEVIAECFPVAVESLSLPVGMWGTVFLTYGDGFREEITTLGDFYLNADHVSSGVSGYVVYYDKDSNGVTQQVLTEQIPSVAASNISTGEGVKDTITGSAVTLTGGYSANVRVTTGDGVSVNYPVVSGVAFSQQLTPSQLKAGWSADLIVSKTTDGVTGVISTNPIGSGLPVARPPVNVELSQVGKTSSGYTLNGQPATASLPGMTASLPVSHEVALPAVVPASTVNSQPGTILNQSPVTLPTVGSGSNGSLTPSDIKTAISAAVGNGHPTVTIESVAPVPAAVAASAVSSVNRLNAIGQSVIAVQTKTVLLFDTLQSISEKLIPKITFVPGDQPSFEFGSVTVPLPQTPGWLYNLMKAMILIIAAPLCFFGVTKIWSY